MKHLLRYISVCLICLLCIRVSVALSHAPEKKPVVIGLDADLSAYAVEGGIAIQRGAQLAIDEINNSGGLLNRQLQLQSLDHRGNPARGIQNIAYFAKVNDLLAVMGGVHTPVALAELESIHNHNVLYLSPWAAGTQIVDNSFKPNNVFRVSIRDDEAGKVLINAAADKGIKRIALVLEKTGWGRSNLASLTAAAKEKQLTIVSTHWINWQQGDFAIDAKLIQQSAAEGVVLVTNAPEGAIVVNALLSAFVTQPAPPVISHWGIAGGNFVNRLGIEKLSQLNISVIQTFNFLSAKSPQSEHLLNAYRKKYGNVDAKGISAVVGLAHAYDLVHLLAESVRQANSFRTDRVREAMENLKSYNGVVKHYSPPFTKKIRDALMAKDYFMATFDQEGHLVPVERKK